MERSKLPVFTYLNTVKLAGSWTLRSKSCITVSGSIFYLDSDITLFLTMSTEFWHSRFPVGKMPSFACSCASTQSAANTLRELFVTAFKSLA